MYRVPGWNSVVRAVEKFKRRVPRAYEVVRLALLSLVILAVVAFLSYCSYRDNWQAWVGLKKTFWEWLELLVPAALVAYGINRAGQRVARGRMITELLKLHEAEADPEQGDARRAISSRSYHWLESSNGYRVVRDKFPSWVARSWYKEFDAGRRRLTHFWFRAALLVDQGVLRKEELFSSFDLACVEVLEPLETILAEDIAEQRLEKRDWLPMKLYIAWLNWKGETDKAKEFTPTLPARWDLYQKSLLKDDET